jgi:hypothetical protein
MATYGSTYQGTMANEAHGPERRAPRIHLKWNSIFGGSVIGWGVLFFLSLLGLTIGLAAIEPYSTRPGSGLDTGSGIWGVVSLILSSILGAYCVVRLAGERRKREAAFHGAISWGLSMIVGALLAFAATSTAARATAENPPRTTARTDNAGNVRMSRADRDRLDEAKSGAAKAAGVSTAAAFLSLLGALLGAGLAAVSSRGQNVRDSFRFGRRDESGDRELGHTSVAASSLGTDAADRDLGERDTPTILPPTH